MAEIPPEVKKLTTEHRSIKSVLERLIDDNDVEFSNKMLECFIGKRVIVIEEKTKSKQEGTVYNAVYYPDSLPYEYDFYLHIKFDNGADGCSNIEYVEFI